MRRKNSEAVLNCGTGPASRPTQATRAAVIERVDDVAEERPADVVDRQVDALRRR